MSLVGKLVRPSMAVGRRFLRTSPQLASSKSLQNVDPNNYYVEPRVPTMDDLVEPYGSWKVAYAAEKKHANFVLLRGIVCLAATAVIFVTSGVLDGLYMPNLDNIMEDTEPYNFDTEGRISV